MTKKDFPEGVIEKTLRNWFDIDGVIEPNQVEFWIFCDFYDPTLDYLSVQRVDMGARLLCHQP